MRAFLDTNIFISYLLEVSENSPISQCITAAVLGDYTLLLSETLLDEFTRHVATKPYLARRIDTGSVERFVGDLLLIAEVIPPITTAIPHVTRDPKDDYLLAYALVGQADYLVTGDDDLLVIGQVGAMQIVTPRQFAALLYR